MFGQQAVVQTTVAAAVFPWCSGSRLRCRLQWWRQYSPDNQAAGHGTSYSGGGSIPLMFGQQAVVQATVAAAVFPLVFGQQAAVQVTVGAAVFP